MVEVNYDFQTFFDNKNWRGLKQALNEYDSIQIAEILEDLDENEEIIVFRLLSREQAKEVFQLLSQDKQEDIIDGIAHNVQNLSNLLNDIEPDDRTAFFEELPGKVSQRLIQLLSPKEKQITLQLLGYPEDSIGRLMTPEYVAIKANYTVEKAFQHIRKYGRDSETLNVIYIVDDDRKLVDDIKIKDLILANPEEKISDLIDSKYVALNVMDDQETAIKAFSDYDRVALPVIDNEGVLLGIVTFDDIMDVAEEESTEDFHKFGSIQTAITNPLKERVFNLYKNRIVWLIALVFMNIFSGAAISYYENMIEAVVALVFFLPLLIDSAGNAGSQSATLMIRALAVGDVEVKDWYKLIWKELLVSVLLGVTMAAAVVLLASFRAPEIILVLFITMFLIVITGSLVGLLLPFIFTKLKLDPATASAPLITSIADICGVLIYFSVANWILVI
ncbi:MAG: magnesium transporter [Bacteroidales bacterium]|jgi:magnesium transporter|nr:magnesium transporter [Bacteroidales bacterium]MCK9498561.1 magnesium transporter [Bacteroidales bacterium]MDY0314457.1 magnesium transporter [Bacteroidales bacterium]NLB85634.1 magnesium transporter [Bacteroidales bacterium]